MARRCDVYRSPRRAGLYLYVDAAEGLARVPEALLERFGTPVKVLSFELTPERRLARVEAAAVLAALDAQGYFLQLPPQPGREIGA